MWQMPSAQWAAIMQMENLRLQQIAAMQSAMINTMSQEIRCQKGEMEGEHHLNRQISEEFPEKLLRRPMEPMKIQTPETLSPQSSTSLPTFSYLSPLSSPASVPSPMALPAQGPPPGLELMVPELRDGLEHLEDQTVENLKGLSISTLTYADRIVTSVVWQIANPQAKLQVSCGSALVSPTFSAGGMEGLRLLFSPGECWWHEFQAKKAKKAKRRAERLPRFGALQLKLAGDLGKGALAVTLVFSVAGAKQAPLTVTTGHSTCLTNELESDWRQDLESAGGSLVVGVDIITGHECD